jgi:hydroxymethylglutaryl-CoA lyase
MPCRDGKNQYPQQRKIEYINSLLKVGFDTIDFGSFVSPKAIPQMADTSEGS